MHIDPAGSAGNQSPVNPGTGRDALNRHIQKTARENRTIKYQKPPVQDFRKSKWKKKRGAVNTASEVMRTFGTDKVFRKQQGPDPVKQSGNQVLQRGVTNSIRLGTDTGNQEITGSVYVNNNNVVKAWETGYSSESRDIVIDYSHSAGEKAAEAHAKGSAEVDLSA